MKDEWQQKEHRDCTVSLFALLFFCFASTANASIHFGFNYGRVDEHVRSHVDGSRCCLLHFIKNENIRQKIGRQMRCALSSLRSNRGFSHFLANHVLIASARVCANVTADGDDLMPCSTCVLRILTIDFRPELLLSMKPFLSRAHLHACAFSTRRRRTCQRDDTCTCNSECVIDAHQFAFGSMSTSRVFSHRRNCNRHFESVREQCVTVGLESKITESSKRSANEFEFGNSKGFSLCCGLTLIFLQCAQAAEFNESKLIFSWCKENYFRFIFDLLL